MAGAYASLAGEDKSGSRPYGSGTRIRHRTPGAAFPIAPRPLLSDAILTLPRASLTMPAGGGSSRMGRFGVIAAAAAVLCGGDARAQITVLAERPVTVERSCARLFPAACNGRGYAGRVFEPVGESPAEAPSAPSGTVHLIGAGADSVVAGLSARRHSGTRLVPIAPANGSPAAARGAGEFDPASWRFVGAAVPPSGAPVGTPGVPAGSDGPKAAMAQMRGAALRQRVLGR